MCESIDGLIDWNCRLLLTFPPFSWFQKTVRISFFLFVLVFDSTTTASSSYLLRIYRPKKNHQHKFELVKLARIVLTITLILVAAAVVVAAIIIILFLAYATSAVTSYRYEIIIIHVFITCKMAFCAFSSVLFFELKSIWNYFVFGSLLQLIENFNFQQSTFIRKLSRSQNTFSNNIIVLWLLLSLNVYTQLPWINTLFHKRRVKGGRVLKSCTCCWV